MGWIKTVQIMAPSAFCADGYLVVIACHAFPLEAMTQHAFSKIE